MEFFWKNTKLIFAFNYFHRVAPSSFAHGENSDVFWQHDFFRGYSGFEKAGINKNKMTIATHIKTSCLTDEVTKKFESNQCIIPRVLTF